MSKLELVDLLLQILSVHRIIGRCLTQNFQKLSQALWAHNLWRMFCAGFRHSAGFHDMVLDGVAFRLVVLEGVDDALGVLGVDHVVPDVARVVMSW